MLSIKDLEIVLADPKTIEDKSYTAIWNGYIIYKKIPLIDIVGFDFPEQEREGKSGSYKAKRNISISIDKENPVGQFNIEIKKNKEGQNYTAIKSSNTTMFDMCGPFSGVIKDKAEGPSICLRFNQKSYEFWTDPVAIEDFNKDNNLNLAPKSFVLDNADFEIDKDKQKMLNEVYAEFEEWYIKWFPMGEGAMAIQDRQQKRADATRVLELCKKSSASTTSNDVKESAEDIANALFAGG